MKRIFALLLCIAIPSVVFAADADSGYKVAYDGGSLPNVKVGSGLKLIVNSSTITLVKDKRRLPRFLHPLSLKLVTVKTFIGALEQLSG